MKISILSYSGLTPAHIARLQKLGEVLQFDETETEEHATERLAGAEVAVIDQSDVILTEELLTSCPSLKYAVLNSTGFGKIDTVLARAYGVSIANVPGYSTDAVAEHTIGAAFALTRHIIEADTAMKKGPFTFDPLVSSHQIFEGKTLRGKVWGVIGVGQIGARVCELAHALGMQVIFSNRTPKEIVRARHVDLDTLFRESDVISLHTAVADVYTSVINAESIRRMKADTIIINTAYAGCVDEKAVATALSEDYLGGFATDILQNRELSNPLLTAPRVILSPHIAFFTKESLENMGEIITSNIEAFAHGIQRNVVNS